MGKKKEVVEGSTKRLLADVSGMKIYSDSIYVITGKSDETAPDGYQERGISKSPFLGNKTIVPCPFDAKLRVYDTGFYAGSKCFKGMPEYEKKEELDRRIKNIKAPYEEATGQDLSQDNNDFWDTTTVRNYDSRLFYTDDIYDLFDLYISLQSKLLTPKDEDGNPEFQKSMYCVEDKTTAVDIRKQRQLDKTEIIYQFMSMLKGTEKQQQNIKDLLMYLNVISSVKLENSMIQYSFTNWIEQKNTNIDVYKDAYRRFISNNQEDRGPQIIAFHRMIKEMVYSGVLKIESTGIIFMGNSLGPDYITAAMSVVDNKDMLEYKALLLEEYNKMIDKQEKIANGVNV